MASSDQITPFGFVLLALIGEHGASPHEMIDMIRRGAPVFWSAAPSKIYDQPKRLERLGYLISHKEPGRTHDRTVYELTAKGRTALREWLTRPSPFPRIHHEASVRLLAGDMIADEEIVASLRALRAEAEGIGALVAEMEAAAGRFPHRQRYLRLEHSLARRILQAHLDWVDEVERELG